MSVIRGQITKLTLFYLLAITNCQEKLTTTQLDLSQGDAAIGPVAISTTIEDAEVLNNLGEKASDELGPNVVNARNDTLDSMDPTGNHSISHSTDPGLIINVVNTTFSHGQGLIITAHNLTHNTIQTVSGVHGHIAKFGHDSVGHVKDNVIDVLNHTRQLPSSPLSAATGVGRAVGNLTMGTLDRLTGFRKYVLKDEQEKATTQPDLSQGILTISPVVISKTTEDAQVLKKLGKKVVDELDNVVNAGNDTLDSMDHIANHSMSHSTDPGLIINLVNLTFSHGQGLITMGHNLTHNTIQTVSGVHGHIAEFGHDSVGHVKDKVINVLNRTHKLTELSKKVVNRLADIKINANVNIDFNINANLRLSGVQGLATDVHNLAHNTLTDVKDNVVDVLDSTGKLTTGVGRAVGNLTMGTLDRVADVNNNVVNRTLSGVQGLTTNLHNLTHNTLQTVSGVHGHIAKFGHDSVGHVKDNVIDVLNHTRQLPSSPLSAAKGVGLAVHNLTKGYWDRLYG